MADGRGRRGGGLRRAVDLFMRSLAGLVLLFLLLFVAYMAVPVPSTLMLGRWLTFQPVERQWVPLSEISPNLVRAVIASEDQRYCSHRGVDWVELNAVMEDEDGPSRGASTLTMQTAKNVFLWPGRSYLRKGLEIPLAMAMDFAWGKKRVIEVYLNVAEWGDGLYGAEAASQRYFGKPAARLSLAEAARLAAALPNPLLRDPARPNGTLRAATARIQRRIGQLGPLGDCALPG